MFNTTQTLANSGHLHHRMHFLRHAFLPSRGREKTKKLPSSWTWRTWSGTSDVPHTSQIFMAASLGQPQGKGKRSHSSVSRSQSHSAAVWEASAPQPGRHSVDSKSMNPSNANWLVICSLIMWHRAEELFLSVTAHTPTLHSHIPPAPPPTPYPSVLLCTATLVHRVHLRTGCFQATGIQRKRLI